MAKVFPALLCLLILALTVLACAPAASTGSDDPVQSRLQRRQSAAAPASTFATPVPVVDPSNCARFPDIADRQREHDAIQWQLCPVIENGILRAAGTTTGYRVHGGGRNFPTFVIQYRDTDDPFLVIRRRYPEGYRPRSSYGYVVNQSGRVVGVPAYKSTSRSVTATDWEVRPQFFSIEARVGKPNEPVDLWVWGSDAPKAYENSLQGRRHRGLRGWVLPAGRGEFNTKPLAIRSIGYIEPAATPGPSSGPSATIPTPTAPPTMPPKPTRLPTVTPWAPPPTPTAEPWLTFSPRHYYSLQLPEGDWKKRLDERSGQDGATTHWVGYQFPAQEPQVAVLVQSRFGLPRDTTVYDLLADEVAFFSELDGFAEVSTQEVSPGILRTHFKHFDIGTCRSGSDMFGLHIKAKPRSYTVLVDICNFKFSKFDERFVERVFDGFSYE